MLGTKLKNVGLRWINLAENYELRKTLNSSIVIRTTLGNEIKSSSLKCLS